MKIVVCKGNKALEIKFRQRLFLEERCLLSLDGSLYQVTVFQNGLEAKHWQLVCPAKDGEPMQRLQNGEELNLVRPDRQGRLPNVDAEKIRVKMEK